MSQPVTVPATVVIAAGVATANFGSPGVGFVWTGSVSIPQAASGNVNPVTWHATAGMAPQATFYNDQASGTVQVASGDSLTLVGTNLAAGTYTAYFVGVQDPTTAAPSVWPGPAPAPPPGAPQQIVSNNVPLPAGTTQIGSNQPVVVGTSLEIFECITSHQGAGSNVRLAIQWSIDNSFVDPIEYDFDLLDITQMRGLILPNLAPFVRFLGKTGGGQEQISLTAFTGLPPIVRSPIVRGVTLAPAGGMLVSYGGPFPAGSTTFALPPYVGQAMLSGESVGAANKFEITVEAVDYLGNSSRKVFVVDSTFDPNGVRIILPTQIWIPPQICTLTVINGNGVQEPGDFQLVALGP